MDDLTWRDVVFSDLMLMIVFVVVCLISLVFATSGEPGVGYAILLADFIGMFLRSVRWDPDYDED